MKAIKRLKQYIDIKGFTNSSFEKKNELSNGYIATQLKRNADLGEGVILKILDNCLDLNSEWLLTGKGSMLKEVENEKVENKNNDTENKITELQIQIKEKDQQISQLINTLSVLTKKIEDNSI